MDDLADREGDGLTDARDRSLGEPRALLTVSTSSIRADTPQPHSHPAAAALLVGLGVTELSCTPAAVHDVKAAIRQVDLAACRKLASAALELASPREVRDLVSASKK